MYEIAILTNGDHVMYEKQKEVWLFPMIVGIHVDKNNQPYIRFDPMTSFAVEDKLNQIKEQHVMTRYEPSEGMIEARVEFENRYKMRLAEQDGQKFNVLNNTIH